MAGKGKARFSVTRRMVGGRKTGRSHRSLMILVLPLLIGATGHARADVTIPWQSSLVQTAAADTAAGLGDSEPAVSTFPLDPQDATWLSTDNEADHYFHVHVAPTVSAVQLSLAVSTLMAVDRPLVRAFADGLHEPAAEESGWPRAMRWMGEPAFLATASALPMLIDGEHGRQAGTKALKALGTTTLVVTGLKYAIGRQRPDQTGGHIVFEGPGLEGSSFPSGHTAAAFSVATVMAHEYPRYRYVFWGLAAVVGAGRVRSGAHFPTDVLAGAGVGIYLGNRAYRGNTKLLSWSF